MPFLSIIVAADEKGGIGRAGQLPWHLPADLQHFRTLTWGKPIVMGRRTWESIGRPLPGRTSIVITRRPGFAAPGAIVAPSLDEALAAAGEAAEVCVIGGAEIYRLALARTQVIYLTRVRATVDADTFFPPLDLERWEEAHREDFPADERHAHPYSFVQLRRSA